MEAIEIRKNGQQQNKALIKASLILAVGYPLIVFMDGGRIRPVFTCFVAFAAVTCIVRLFQSKTGPKSNEPVIVIDKDGLLDTRLKVGKILWPDITRVYRTNLNSVPYICIETRRDDFYLDRRSAPMKMLLKLSPVSGLKPLTISAAFLDMDADRMFNVIAAQQAMAWKYPGVDPKSLVMVDLGQQWPSKFDAYLSPILAIAGVAFVFWLRKKDATRWTAQRQ